MGVTVEVFIPGWFVKDKAIDYPAEIAGCCGAALTIGRGVRRVRIPSPPIGYFALLELIESDFFRHPSDCSLLEVGRALVLAERLTRMMPPDSAALDRRALALIRRHGEEIRIRYGEIAQFLLETPFNGFAMLQNAGSGGGEPFLFGGPTLARIVSIGAQYAHLSARESLWKLPLALAGHLAAANDAGKNPPKRPKDAADLAQQQREAVEREVVGAIHPWQLIDPDHYPLTDYQKLKNPDWEERLQHGA